jgi:hypothetical protein
LTVFAISFMLSASVGDRIGASLCASLGMLSVLRYNAKSEPEYDTYFGVSMVLMVFWFVNIIVTFVL